MRMTAEALNHALPKFLTHEGVHKTAWLFQALLFGDHFLCSTRPQEHEILRKSTHICNSADVSECRRHRYLWLRVCFQSTMDLKDDASNFKVYPGLQVHTRSIFPTTVPLSPSFMTFLVWSEYPFQSISYYFFYSNP